MRCLEVCNSNCGDSQAQHSWPGVVTLVLIYACTLMSQDTAERRDEERLQRIEQFKRKASPASPWQYSFRDAILYALSIGCKGTERRFVYENDPDFATLPSFAVVAVHKAKLDYQQLLPNFDAVSRLLSSHTDKLMHEYSNLSDTACILYDSQLKFARLSASLFSREQLHHMAYALQRQLLHGEQFVQIFSHLPVNGNFTVQPSLVDIQDKGKAALVITRASIVDPDDNNRLYATNEVTAFVRKSGGFGRTKPVPRPAAATAANKPPARQPDAVIEEQTSPDLAALYRLNADYNPLHIDSDFSSEGGFDAPILHGLCTFGISTKHVMKQYAHGEPSRIKSIKVRKQHGVPPGWACSLNRRHRSSAGKCSDRRKMLPFNVRVPEAGSTVTMLHLAMCTGTVRHVCFPWGDSEDRNVAAEST